MSTSASFVMYRKCRELKFSNLLVGVFSEHHQYFKKSYSSNPSHLGKPAWLIAFLPMALEGP
jgi:hypothetical protein